MLKSIATTTLVKSRLNNGKGRVTPAVHERWRQALDLTLDSAVLAKDGCQRKGRLAMLGTVLLVVLILLLLGAVPSWPHSRNWGYGPSGLLGIVLIVILIMVLTGRM